MLQVARLAPRQLGESRDLVAAFVRAQMNADGGFRDRAGASDLYYTVFGLDALVALQEPAPAAEAAAFLDTCTAALPSELVGLGCLARGWAAIKRPLAADVRDRIVAGIEVHRTPDGGYATTAGAQHGTAYGAFLAVGAYDDLGVEVPQPDRVLASLQSLRTPDGGYANMPGVPAGLSTASAAAIVVQRRLGGPADRAAGMWLLNHCHQRGGFFASASTPIPDLLSTATALHALAALQIPTAGVRESCLDFIDSLWTNRGGFYGSWADDTIDVEYTYYALLALGHLSLDAA